MQRILTTILPFIVLYFFVISLGQALSPKEEELGKVDYWKGYTH